MARHDRKGRTQETVTRHEQLSDSPLFGRRRAEDDEQNSSSRSERKKSSSNERSPIEWKRRKNLRPLKLDLGDDDETLRREKDPRTGSPPQARIQSQNPEPQKSAAPVSPSGPSAALGQKNYPTNTRYPEPSSAQGELQRTFPADARFSESEKDAPAAQEMASARQGDFSERKRLPYQSFRLPREPEVQESLGKKVLRQTIGVVICVLAAGFYILWMQQTADFDMPSMVTPQPYFYEEEQPVRALLLWHEKVIQSPTAGTVQLTYGGKPAVVASGDVVATVLSRGGTTNVLAPSRGYFVPAIDGAEDSWDYASLWLGSGLLPETPRVSWIQDLAPLGGDRVIGKLILLPQNPRAIFYVNLTDKLLDELQRGSILIRRDSRGPKWTADVRVYVKYGEQRAKVALDMPFFSMDMVNSREMNFLVCSDEESGLLVPDSAVVLRSGTYGVFELVGDQLVFRSVTGKPLKDSMFFISSGLSPGNPVILNAANAEEKRVRLW